MSQKEKILIIEDDVFLGDLISKKLKQEGFEVIHATDGQQGIEKAKETNPDLILLDLILPEMDGFEALKTLKSTVETDSIPVIILSNLGQKEDVERGFDLGADDYLIKAHFTPDEIIKRVRTPLK